MIAAQAIALHIEKVEREEEIADNRPPLFRVAPESPSETAVSW